MEVFNLLYRLVLSGVIMKVVVAEECIRWQDHQKELSNCCRFDPPYPREAMAACQQEAVDKAGSTDRAEFMACLFECYFDELGIVTDNTMHLDKISEHLQSMSEDVQNAVLEAYKTCEAKTTGEQRVCHSYAQELEMCFLFEISDTCPVELYNPSEICDKRRAGVKYCDE